MRSWPRTTAAWSTRPGRSSPRTSRRSSGRCPMCGTRSGGAGSSPRWSRCRPPRWPGAREVAGHAAVPPAGRRGPGRGVRRGRERRAAAVAGASRSCWPPGRRAKVGPDIHAKVGRALYSVPWRHIGQQRRRPGHRHDGAVLPRRAAGQDPPAQGPRASRPTSAHYPPEKIAFHMRTPTWCRRQAAEHRPGLRGGDRRAAGRQRAVPAARRPGRRSAWPTSTTPAGSRPPAPRRPRPGTRPTAPSRASSPPAPRPTRARARPGTAGRRGAPARPARCSPTSSPAHPSPRSTADPTDQRGSTTTPHRATHRARRRCTPATAIRRLTVTDRDRNRHDHRSTPRCATPAHAEAVRHARTPSTPASPRPAPGNSATWSSCRSCARTRSPAATPLSHGPPAPPRPVRGTSHPGRLRLRRQPRSCPPRRSATSPRCAGSHAGESVILYGPVGVGKTHVAQALGHLAIRAGAEVRFAKTSRVLADLAGGHADRTWDPPARASSPAPPS